MKKHSNVFECFIVRPAGKDPGLLADQRYLTEEFLGNCANAADLRKRRNRLRDDWLYENIPLYKYAVDFAGSKDFKIRVPEELKDHNLSGTFWVSKKDKGSAVINLDELSEYVARGVPLRRSATRVEGVAK